MSQKLDLDFYQALIEHALEGIVVIGMDGKVRYASESAQNILGYPLGENIGRNVYDLIHPDDIKPLQRYFLRLTKEPELILNAEIRLKHRDGSWRMIEGIGKSHTFIGEKSPTIVINYRDVTERRKIDQEMKRLASIVENSTDAIFLITHTGVVLSWNHGGRLVYGYTAEEIGGRSVHMLLAPGRVQEFERILETVRKDNAVNNFETIHRRKDGSEVLVSMTVSPLAEKKGEITRASVIARPVLEREQADAIRKALQLERDELIQRLQLQMERMPIACLLHDHQSRITYINPAAEKTFGYTFTEVNGKSPIGVIVPEFKWAFVKGVFEKLTQGDMSPGGILGEGLHKDGRILLCEWYNTPLFDAEGRFTGHITMVLDVTERKKAEEMMARFAAVAEYSDDAILGIDMDGNITSWNRGAEKMYGYKASEAVGKRSSICHPPEHQQDFRKFGGKILKGERIVDYEAVRVRKDGRRINVSFTLSPIRNADGKIIGASSIARDITERKKAEETTAQFAAVAEYSDDAILGIDMNGNITSWNKGAEKTYGYKADEVLGKSSAICQPEDQKEDYERFRELVLQGKFVANHETVRVRKNGQKFEASITVSPIRNAKNEVIGASAITRDITMRKKAEEMTARFASVAEYSDDAILGIDMDGNITSWNKGAEKIYGYKAAEVLGKSSSICQPEDQKQDYNLFRELILRGRFISNYETVRVRKDGKKFAVSLTVSPIRNAEGEVIGASAITRDISEKKRAEEVTARFAAVVEHSEDAIIGVDLDGNVTSWNKGAEKIYGYRTSEAVGKNIAFYMPREYTPDVPRFLSMARKGEAVSNYETVRVRKDGQKINVAVTVSPVRDPAGAIAGVSVIARDVSEQKKGEEARARLAAIVESTTDAITGSDLEGRITTWSPGAEAMYGWKAGEAIGQDISIIAPEGLKNELIGIRAIIDRGESLSNIETVRRRKNGENVQVSLSLAPVRDSKGRVIGVSAIARDISEKKKAEEMMARFAAVAMYSNDAIVGMDLDGNITSWNKGAERIFGYPADLVVGINLTPYLPRGQRKADLHFLKRVQKGEVVSEYETFHVRRDGQKTDLVVTGSPVRDPQGNLAGISFIVRDISERKKAEAELRRHEEQLRLTQKMDTIGRLAGGVAHDFNNLLSVIRGNTEYLLRSFPPEDNRREEMSEILKAVQRGAEMTKQLLVFGKKQIAKPQPLNLNDLSLEMERMLKRLVEANIDLAIIPGEDLDQIEADHGQIQEVILNLVLNACDAMPKGGHIIIETKNDTFSEPQRDSRVVIPPGHYVRLNVTDTGKGMDRETQKHLFEPFFSTKKRKGSGLGLATVFSIVKRWKGHLALHSSPGLGSTFSIFFPAVGKKLEPQATTKPTASMPKGTETILLAEDEKPLRKIIAYTLKSHGYQVLEADNGEEALKKAGKYRKTIHLLLTDIIMPRMDGKELSDKLRKKRPGLRVIFISGYPREILSKRGVLRKGVQLLKKPFSMEELIRQIQKVLESEKKR